MKENPSYYAIVPANVRYDKDLVPNAKLLYGEISALTSKEGFCWASNEYFSKLYDVDKTRISKWISQLEEKGHISVEITPQKRYICIAPLSKRTSPLVQKDKHSITSSIKNNTTEAPKVASLSLEETQYIQCDEEGNTVAIKKPKVRNTAVDPTRAAAVRASKQTPPFDFDTEFEKLRTSTYIPKKVVALVWHRKGYRFENWDQFNANLGRDMKLAQPLVGYTGKQIGQTIDFCEKDSIKNGYEWTVATITKKIASIINKK